MATTALGDNPAHTVGDLPQPGSAAPSYTLTGTDLAEVDSADLAGRRVVLNVFPSVDTNTCATSVRRFNELAASFENTTVVCVSADLPFALRRFWGEEGISDAVVAASSFRSSFGSDFGVTLTDTGMRGLLARSVVVIDTDGTVRHSELVPNIGIEPDYDAVVAALA
jgi:thiol peroxidase